ncbi:MAG: leucine-rich repeat protein [Dysgonamonadaceae bacterium]|jgi:hypothetical protein|nr:leucine-rich repeat protein [Dysgonamonadaceae bacterium]
MKKYLILLFTLCCLLKVNAQEAPVSGYCGENLTYTFSDSVLTVSGFGLTYDFWDWDGKLAPWHSYASDIKEVILPEGLTYIGSWLFSGCSSLTSIHIPEGVKRIEQYAFNNCVGLRSLYIPKSVYHFAGNAIENSPLLTSVVTNRPVPLNFFCGGDLATATLTVPPGSSDCYRNTLAWCSRSGAIEEADSLASDEPFVTCSDNFTWMLEDSVFTISGTGGMCPMSSAKPWDSVKESIKTVVIGDGVENICSNSFRGCTSLSSVSIPSSVTFIEDWAFGYCTSLISIIIPEGVTVIKGSAFDNCRQLTHVTFPSTLIRIEGWAFADCGNVKTVRVLHSEPQEIASDDGFPSRLGITLQVPQGSLEAYRQAEWWKDFGNIKEFAPADPEDPDDTEDPDEGLCGDNLTWSLNDSVLTISGTGRMWDFGDWRRFESPLHSSEEASTEFKKSIKTVIIEEGVTTVGANAFAHCPSLTSATIPEGVTAIGAYAFTNCYSLTSVIIPNSVTSIGLEAFAYDFSLTSATLPEGLSRIERGVFFADTVLVSVNIPDSVTSIGVYAFTHCYALTSVNLPKGLSCIEEYAFANTGLVSVTIPCSVKEINNCAFGSCHSLEKITVSYPRPIRIEPSVFYNFLYWEALELEDITLEVPLDCSSVYAGSEVWSEFNIVESPNNTVCGGDATLDSLTVNAVNAAISFPFHPDTLNYAFDVENAIDSIIIKAVSNDKHASVTGEGRYPLTVWENTFTVEVTAENGIASRIYTVKVTRLPADPNPDSVSLKNLVVSIGSLNPEFDRNIFNYTVQLPCPVNSVTIGATPGDTFSTVSGGGTYRFPCGGNPFTVTVTVTKPHPRKPQKDYRIRINPEYPTGLEKTGKQPVQVYFDSNILHLDSPAAEHINIYSVTGTLLYGFDKPAGAFTVHRSPFYLSPVLIVKGGSGWSKKLVVND